MKKTLAAAVGLAAAASLMTVAPAHAGPATGNVSVGTSFGSVMRAQFRQNVDGSGYYWRTYGSSSCTSSTSTPDFSWSNMNSNSNWDNVASYIQDYNYCDVIIYQYTDFNTALTGYVNYGSGGQSLQGAGLNNLTSSYRVS